MQFGRYIICVLFAYSCSFKPKVPNDIMSPATMEKVLLDMMRTDEYLAQNSNNDSLRLIRTKLYQQVLQINHTSKEHFQRSFNFYQSRPDLFKIILDSMHNHQMMPPITERIDTLRNNIKKPAL
jgi:hypothetical protein